MNSLKQYFRNGIVSVYSPQLISFMSFYMVVGICVCVLTTISMISLRDLNFFASPCVTNRIWNKLFDKNR